MFSTKIVFRKELNTLHRSLQQSISQKLVAKILYIRLAYMNNKSDYINLGLSSIMGPKLRSTIEDFLKKDLNHYGLKNTYVIFDWSQSCIEGHDCNILDGGLGNFSGIRLFDQNDNIVADGWMEYIAEGWSNSNSEFSFFIAYWDNLETLNPDILPGGKDKFGIPLHIWEQIPPDLRWQFETDRM